MNTFDAGKRALDQRPWPTRQELVDADAELRRLRQLERRVRAIVSYYDDDDLAAHLAAAVDGQPTYHPDGVVRPVWVNHKLVDSFRELRRELLGVDPSTA